MNIIDELIAEEVNPEIIKKKLWCVLLFLIHFTRQQN